MAGTRMGGRVSASGARMSAIQPLPFMSMPRSRRLAVSPSRHLAILASLECLERSKARTLTPGPDPVTVGNQVITQKTLYIALFVIGIPLLILANPLSLFFWLIGSSAILILAHAVLMEPGVESEYSSVEQV